MLVIVLIPALSDLWYWAKRTLAAFDRDDRHRASRSASRPAPETAFEVSNPIDDQIASLLRDTFSKHEAQEAGTDLVTVRAVVSLVPPRLRSAFVIVTSAAVITLITAFTFVGSPPAGPKPKRDPTPQLHYTRGAAPDCPQPRPPRMTGSKCQVLIMRTGN